MGTDWVYAGVYIYRVVTNPWDIIGTECCVRF